MSKKTSGYAFGHCGCGLTAGCEYCNPLVTYHTTTPVVITEEPLTDDEIRKVRQLLAERKHEALLEKAKDKPLERGSW
jgi:hypothetical protein